MEYRVIRGRDKIGGTITEIFTLDNTKIWVDFGAELSVKPEESSDEEMIQLLKKEKPKAILFTHIHGDHIGLLYAIPKEIDIYMGKLAKKMLINIRETLVKVEALERVEKAKLQKELEILNSTQVKLYEDKKTDRIGNILFTPYRVDHSVPDAYMLRFEAEGKSIVHTGDFRNHGYLGKNLLEDIQNGIGKCKTDILIIEGTMMSRKTEKCRTEKEMEREATKLLLDNKYAFLICSSTNMESLASFYRATIESGKKRSKLENRECKPALICNSYVKKQLSLFTEEVGEKEDWRFQFHRSYPIRDGLNRVYAGKTQKQHMIEDGFTMIVGTSDYYRDIMREFSSLNPKPIVIYSMWDGYLVPGKEYSNEALISLEKEWHERFVRLHTSGHATAKTIADVINVINPQERIVPVHTENPQGFLELRISKEMKYRMDIEFIPEHYASKDDCRALRRDGDLWKSLNGGALAPIVKLVRKKPDLELCFRGNSGNESVTVYYNNNEFLRFDSKSKPYFNRNHSRYQKEPLKEIEKLQHLLNDFFDFEEIYTVRKRMMDTYFNKELELDYFKGKDGIKAARKKDCKYEKQEQQKLMSANVNRENGYYIYDMEYAQAFESEAVKIIYEKNTNGQHNKPDSLAIRYENGKPVKLVFVELKTTSTAMQGKSSAINHMAGMRNFVNWDLVNNKGEFLRNRKIEAKKVMEEYQDLNLHSCGDRPIEDFEHLDVELLLVITDNKGIMKNEKTAKSYYDTHKNAIDKAAHDSCCGILVLPENDFELRYEDVVYY